MRSRTGLALAGLLISASLCGATAIAASQAEQSGPDELLLADMAFSRSGAKQPLVDAVSAMLDEGAIMPVPTGAFAKGRTAVAEALRANPLNASARAKWAPVRAGLSADRTHGFTYGFMTISEDGKPDRRAKYLAYWIKRPAGWRVAAYKRAPSGPGDVQTALRPAVVPGIAAKSTGSEAELLAGLKAAEKAFSDRAQKIGLGRAFVEFGSPEAMNMGQGPDFTLGNAAIGRDMPTAVPSALSWAADEGALVAPSGDLGVTFGYIRPNGPVEPGRPAAIPFFTVWHRASPDAPWRYIAE